MSAAAREVLEASRSRNRRRRRSSRSHGTSSFPVDPDYRASRRGPPTVGSAYFRALTTDLRAEAHSGD